MTQFQAALAAEACSHWRKPVVEIVLKIKPWNGDRKNDIAYLSPFHGSISLALVSTGLCLWLHASAAKAA